ncbi:adipose-secreted signaling protein-like [Apostichopus japonicus]|uniref:adipose-secreted signaling protein-like n=1 Tax=Stichopus japonicus TaxID=307972 RepID=UPI003AB2B71E
MDDTKIQADLPATPTKERRRSRTNSRVHFPEDVHDSQIQASHEYNAMIDVNLGFLQTHHIYEVQFTVRDSVTGPVTASIDRQVIVKSIEAFPTQDGTGHDVILTVLGHKDGIINESFKLTSQSDPNQKVTVMLHTKVLGKDQGTPLLKDGIHLVGTEGGDEASESSDASTAAE